MKKNWENPELKALSVEYTHFDETTIAIADNEFGEGAEYYTEEQADVVQTATTFRLKTYYFYDICACKWFSTRQHNLCDAIKYAFNYMKTNYPNGCCISA